MFPTDDKNLSVPDRELAIGRFWKEHRIYEKSLALREGAEPFVFYEGPPTANGMPHPGHCLTRAIKDLFPRYRTMRGQRCDRKAGWDTHGLPVEVEVCKELGIHSKEEIEAFGIEPFIQKCQQSVWRYMREWEQLTERLGFWIHMDEAYVTYHQSYVESVWWSLKNLFDRDLLYQGHKIVWWWAQGGTALSAGEVGQGYREVADPSVFVKFPLLDDDGNETDTSLLAWTTTPWTLPSNQYVAVKTDVLYMEAVDPDDPSKKIIFARNLREKLEEKRKLEFEKVGNSFRGSKLCHRRYRPPFNIYFDKKRWKSSQLKRPGPSDPWPDGIREYALHNHFISHTFPVKGSQQAAKLFEKGLDSWVANNKDRPHGWMIIPADFVTTDSGTGLVHVAPAFGEDDYALLLQENKIFGPCVEHPQLINCVGPNGNFTDEGPEYCRGRWVKDCDKDIIRDLKDRGLLYHREQYRHDYPFCWRAEEDPLIQYPRESWFIRTTKFKDQMLANNAEINWLPEHIKDGRFGKFLASNVDWALSRERYWGTPLPIWVCEKTGKQEAVDSYEQLIAKPQASGMEVWEEAKAANPELPDDLRVHKPYIDAVTYDSPFAEGARMRRVTEVIDCWYDSGAMPFAQWGYRGEDASDARDRFEAQFPADFISEAIDQTRGWFYSQLAISTMLFGERKEGSDDSNSAFPHPFRNCIVLGLMLGEDGQKMSKSKRNYLAPDEIFDRFGADALRWYFFANQPPWTSIRYSEQAIKDSIPEFLLRLWNVYSFFTIYANIDRFDPAKELNLETGDPASAGGRSTVQLTPNDFKSAESYRPLAERSELDRWILSELNSTAASVVERMDQYDNYGACQQITQFVDGLSNWYVRRSRDRFWASDKRSPEKLDAYWTLYECLITTAKVIAPFVPFQAESLWQNLATTVFSGPDALRPSESVHLCDYPTGDVNSVDEQLSARMNLVREISSLGRQARSSAQLKVRQPLAKVEVILADRTHQPWLESHAALIADELNVKAVEFTMDADKYIEYQVVPNFKRLGPRLGKNMPAMKKLLSEIDASLLLADLKSAVKVSLALPDGSSIELDEADIEIRLQAKEGWAAAQGPGVVVVLAKELTEQLVAEGLARDLVRVIQDQRKDLGCQFTDRIEVGIVAESQTLTAAIAAHGHYICKETLANSIVQKPLVGPAAHATRIGDTDVELYVQVAS